MRAIDADKLRQDVLDWEDCPNGFSDTYDKARIIDEINYQPTLDVEPVKHGKWIKDGEASALYKCSKCGTLCSLVGYANCIPIEQMNKTMKYCNSCGAKMDEVNE